MAQSMCSSRGSPTKDVALTAGELAAMEYLEAAGLGYGRLRSTATCVDDVKVRRR